MCNEEDCHVITGEKCHDCPMFVVAVVFGALFGFILVAGLLA